MFLDQVKLLHPFSANQHSVFMFFRSIKNEAAAYIPLLSLLMNQSYFSGGTNSSRSLMSQSSTVHIRARTSMSNLLILLLQ